MVHRIAGFGVLAVALVAGCHASGPRPSELGPKVGDEARDFELTDLAGEKVKLSALAEKGPVVLVVLRGNPGYQCPICTAQFAEFRRKAGAFAKAGAQVCFVYPGPADGLKEHAAAFVRGEDYPAHFRILLDPDYAFTTAYGLRWDASGETARPAAFVIDGTRKVAFAKVSTDHGGRASAAEVLAALPGK
ncbi:alkyl hydroperoxide reductase thiol specific antioxidant mal allergen : Redoxin domain protein OS=Planctomyces limnophilus (strain ATCC 43296 / DSM 3776 / IFAM 1008 / 290) GN=Plim_2520 PE=4 SV=1: AhpC-TSA [Gemmataceae bacterium]|jgi:peroxiredoxin|nr:alkyl hydroperoxide reductase thiol specific antioxidant mal allergen : Redoxin domain protein OS=Planctomyces limnophilus (strain ATCC 43296 / DSM 3776 / IFAM 1008 / 290) GN=Plim_2520 PE=4 SV=1: AhpC-TSA [Gemmataceae bacterium]VTT97546.1 alkyl hydroperoxide reductase thiol specific antioxidant mal allergen : Redoxin domain protein OS=Planctomyces limnophilus (strain ATCC 43296 / DSM 3776 / IFAM 1008 / 290) GN=Plim_2520 PE=4 SV=1: AhpC-TSA [Gemmataceae bacterium]